MKLFTVLIIIGCLILQLTSRRLRGKTVTDVQYFTSFFQKHKNMNSSPANQLAYSFVCY